MIYYIGGFPPPYGGVSIKNENLYIALKQKIDIEKIDLSALKRKKSVICFAKFIKCLLSPNNCFVVGVSGKRNRKLLAGFLHVFNCVALRKSIMFLMGGTAANEIVLDKSYRKYVSCYKKIYAETDSMVEALRNTGLENAEYYPNGRFKPKCLAKSPSHSDLRCIFFSKITKDKGVDIVIDTARILPDILFDLFGEIEEGYEQEFINQSCGLSNLQYKGVFKGNSDEVYVKLAEYDFVLLPTRWKYEGVPGILIEAKIAGVPAIVSDICYNAEIVEDGVSGRVLQTNTCDALAETIKEYSSRELLEKLKMTTRESANKYYIENYIDQIVSLLETTS